ncbi:type II secretion system protein GspC [Glaciecola sp. 1036]|uniref:type II secretion system protein GspC n=1 Tax=Alteromonadaceae TaxID=72275 RepID=UPI003CFF34E1
MSSTINTQIVEPIQQIYRRHDTKLVLLVVILLSIYLLSVLAKLTWSLIPQPEVQSANFQPSVNSGQNIGTDQTKTNLNALLDLNLFGDVEQAPPQQKVEEITEAPETQLNLLLSGVVASSEQGKGAAVIAYRNNQATYAIGDTIEGTNVTLEEIYKDRVIIKNRQVRETLMLEGIDYDEANARIEQNRQQTQQSRNQNPQLDQDDVRDIRDQVRASPASFSEFIRLSPEQNNEGLVGYKVAPGNKPEFFEAVGLENGDIITELNGLDLSNPEEAIEAVRLLQSEEWLDLQLLRNGDEISLTIEIPTE